MVQGKLGVRSSYFTLREGELLYTAAWAQRFSKRGDRGGLSHNQQRPRLTVGPPGRFRTTGRSLSSGRLGGKRAWLPAATPRSRRCVGLFHQVLGDEGRRAWAGYRVEQLPLGADTEYGGHFRCSIVTAASQL